MDVKDITPLLDRLDDDIDNLEEALKPLMKALGESGANLPLLDKAKLYIWATYSLESILFSSLRLNGVDARQHPVFAELARVRQYFQKVAKAEEPKEKADTRPEDQKVDTQAAIRFLKSDLGDDKTIKTKLNQQLLKEKLKAARQQQHEKQQKQQQQQQQQQQLLAKRAAQDDTSSSSSSASSSSSSAKSSSRASKEPELPASRKKVKNNNHS